MEETYSDFLQDAAARVRSTYAKELLATLVQNDSGDNLFASAAALIRTAFADLLTVPGFVGGALLICLFALLLKQFGCALGREKVSHAVDALCGLLLAAAVVGAAFETLDGCALYMRDIALFFGALAPVMGILTAAGGNLTAAGAGSVTLSVFLSVSEFVITRLAPVAVTCFLGLALIGATGGSAAMLSLAKGARNVLFGFFSLITSVFFIIVGCQNVAAVQADTVSAKTLRLLVSNAVPIVGGTIGDALKLVSGSLVAVKNATGMAAVLFLVAMFCPVLIRIWLWSILLSLFGFFCECAELGTAKNLFLQVKCAFDFALAVYASVVVMGFLNIGIFMGSLPAVAA